jgi:hypothetical protein
MSGEPLHKALRNFLRAWRLPARPDAAPPPAPPPAPSTKPPAFRGAYAPLYGYLERRYAVTVVLTFVDIEALLGFPLPDAARNNDGWWTAPVLGHDRHASAWIAAHRTAKPNLMARTVAFDRVE